MSDFPPAPSAFRFGELKERSLHRQLKKHYRTPDSVQEHPIGSFIVDIWSPSRGVVEIQTGSFFKLREKLSVLLRDFPITVVYPIARKKILVTWEIDRTAPPSRRKSPKKQEIWDAFRELSMISNFLGHPNLEVQIVFVEEEEHRCRDGRGSWYRNGVSKTDHVLLEILETKVLSNKKDFLDLLPTECPDPFTNKNLAQSIGKKVAIVRNFTSCLKKAGFLIVSGKVGREQLFVRSPG